MAIIQSCESRS